MEENGYRFGVGVLVLASAIIGVLLVAFFGAVPQFWVDRYTVTVNFPNAPNVSVDTPVRKNGVRIGRVSSVFLRPRSGGVDLTLELERKNELQIGETPRIKTGSIITGEAVIEFVPPTREMLLRRFDGTAGTPRDGELDEAELAASAKPITDNSFLSDGQVMGEPIEALLEMQAQFAPVLASMDRTINRFDTVAAAIQDVLGDGTGPVREVMTSAKTTLDNINGTVGTINRVATQIERAEIPRAVADGLTVLPDLFKEAQTTLAQTQRTLHGFETFSASLEEIGKDFDGIGESVKKAIDNANVAIENIAEITDPVAKNSDQLVANAVSALANLDSLSVELRKFSVRLNNSNGTIAKLVDDPRLGAELRDTIVNIRNASANVEGLSRQLQPILGDVRVFTDKIARDPGQIGVRGALSSRPLGVGLK